ncbi:hypothetical protein C8R45DRAFT_1174101, partial [Mycena sanguinolenta]
MQTLARQLEEAGRLGGSFFFKRGDPTRGNGKTLFATIAYQLALSVPCLRTPISKLVEKDPSIVRRSIEMQMQKLITGPCCGHPNVPHVAILIDGLHECEGSDVQQEILRVISLACSPRSTLFRYIVASRPEPHIREVFESPIYRGILRSVNVVQSFDDVRKYLCDEFSRIHREHSTMGNVASPWPAADVVESLVEKSSGYFIYVSTIIKFIDDKNHRPTQRLALVLEAYSTESESPFDALDRLYMTILCSAPRQSEFTPVLCIMVAYSQTISIIEALLGLQTGETELLLRGLHSVIEVSPRMDAITSYHASFLDFLNEASRSQNFH